MTKIAPQSEDIVGCFEFESDFARPLGEGYCMPPLKAYDENYVRRRKEVGQKFFTLKSGRKFCYWTDGAPDPSKEGVAVVLCLHSCGYQKNMWLMKEPFKDIFQISVDRIGHGGSSTTPDGGYMFDDLVPELVELIDGVYSEWKIPPERKFFVTGHSMGACCTIEMAACPAVRDRIEAIAPVSGPADIWNPKTDIKTRNSVAKFLRDKNATKGCCGCFASKMRKVSSEYMPKNAERLKKGEQAKVFEEYYISAEGGDKRAWAVAWADPFILSQSVDCSMGFSSPHGPKDYQNEFDRAFQSPWAYDPCEITVPCFIYNGTKEETPAFLAELNHKLINGSELIMWEAYGHGSISLEFERIIQALVKKQKVEGPPLWSK